jgi:hypothetical protein
LKKKRESARGARERRERETRERDERGREEEGLGSGTQG